MKRIDLDTMTKILQVIHEESQAPNQMSQGDIAELCGVSKPTIGRIFLLLEEENILHTQGSRRNYSYTWQSNRTPCNALAIKIGAVQVKNNKVSDFHDAELISELRKRGYLIFKEY